MGKAPIALEIREEIVRLRRNGYSIPEMHRFLKVSKATISRYSKNVEILPEFKQRWLDRRNASQIISERQKKSANARASELVQNLNNQSLILIAASLYWAEGAKKDFSLTNSDPEMIRIFIIILRKVFNIKSDEIKISIRLYEDLSKEEVVIFWSGVVGINLYNNVSINILKGKKVGKLKYGMCRVRVKKSGLLLKTITAINKRVCEIISS